MRQRSLFNPFDGDPTYTDDAPTSWSQPRADVTQRDAPVWPLPTDEGKTRPARDFHHTRQRIRRRLEPMNSATIPILEREVRPIVEQLTRTLGQVTLVCLLVFPPFFLLCLWYGVGFNLGNKALLAAFVLYLFFPVTDILFLPEVMAWFTEKVMKWDNAPRWFLWAPVVLTQFLALNLFVWLARYG